MPGGGVAARPWDARLSTPGSPVCTPDWLALREGADARARSAELAGRLRDHLVATRNPGAPLVIRDLGCGTGSMGRWLVPRLPGPQHWFLHDRDRELLTRAHRGLPATAQDGTRVRVDTVPGDVTALVPVDLDGTTVVTASALLDLLTAEEVDRIAAVCTAAGCAALLTLTVVGQVAFEPAEELDGVFADAFNAHQRRTVAGRRLLGPDAGAAAVEAFEGRGAVVETRPSPWRLTSCRREAHGLDDGSSLPRRTGSAPGSELLEEWLRGWISAACEQRPQLARHAGGYLQRRLAAIAAGELSVTVGHLDVLALPGEPG